MPGISADRNPGRRKHFSPWWFFSQAGVTAGAADLERTPWRSSVKSPHPMADSSQRASIVREEAPRVTATGMQASAEQETSSTSAMASSASTRPGRAFRISSCAGLTTAISRSPAGRRSPRPIVTMSPKELNQDTASGFTTSSPIEAAWPPGETVGVSVGCPEGTPWTHRAALAFPAATACFTAAASLGRSPPFFFACVAGSIPAITQPKE